MPDASRSNTVDNDDPWASPVPEPGPDDVTPERAKMLAQHAVYVQGGYSDPEREAERARKQLAASPGSIDWARMTAEVQTALEARVADLSAAVTAEEAKQEADSGLDADSAAIAKEVGIDTDLVRRYKDLRAAEKEADSERAAVKEEADKLEQQIVDMYSDAGVPSLSIDGKTVYLHRSTYAQRLPGLTSEDVMAALRASGHGDIVKDTVNGQTLNALVRELCDGDEPKGLPEPLAEVLEMGERFAIRITDAGRKGRTKTTR